MRLTAVPLLPRLEGEGHAFCTCSRMQLPLRDQKACPAWLQDDRTAKLGHLTALQQQAKERESELAKYAESDPDTLDAMSESMITKLLQPSRSVVWSPVILVSKFQCKSGIVRGAIPFAMVTAEAVF